MSLIGKYNLIGDCQSFTVEFEMPDNCNCKKITLGGNYIEVVLKPGQTTPSSNMITKQMTFTATSNIFNVEFQQSAGGVTDNRPKISSEF